MFGFDLESIGVVLGLVASIWGAVIAFSNWRSNVAVAKEKMQTLTKKVSSLEDDMKLITSANKQMSESFHNDIKDLLIAFRGKSGE